MCNVKGNGFGMSSSARGIRMPRYVHIGKYRWINVYRNGYQITPLTGLTIRHDA